MKEMLNRVKAKVSQLSHDVLPDAAGIKRSANFAIDAASSVASEVGRLGKDVLKSDMVKDAAAGAAIGAVVAVPVPLVGPIAGAVIGAGLGVFKNIGRSGVSQPLNLTHQPHDPTVIDVIGVERSTDKYEELNKLHELKVKGALTEEEFAAEKKKILDR